MRTKLKNTQNYLSKLLIVFMISTINCLSAFSGVWNNAAPGFWDNNANWFPNTGFPNGLNQNAGFIGLPTAAVANTINSNTDITVAALHIDISTGQDLNIQFNAPHTLSFLGDQALAKIFKSGTGIARINTPIILNGTLSVFYDNGSIDTALFATGELILSGPISGLGSLALINSQPSLNVTGLTLEGNNIYTGSTSVFGGILRLNSNGISIPGNILVKGASRLEMLQNDQFDDSIVDIQSGGIADILGTTQTIQQLGIIDASFVDSLANLGTGSLTILNSTVFALQFTNTCVLNVPNLTMLNGGGIEAQGQAVIGDSSGTTPFTLNIQPNTDIEVITAFFAAENNYELIMYNPIIPNGSINYNIGGNTGTLALTGNLPGNTIPAINIESGQLLAGLNSTDVIASTGTTTITPAGTLWGFGTFGSLARPILNQGLVEPGDNVNPGILTLLGNYTQINVGTFKIKAPTALTASKLVVKGFVNLDGAFFFEGNNLVAGDSIVVIDNTGGPAPISGKFSSFIPNLNESSAFLKANVVYTPHQVIVNITAGSCVVNPLPPTDLRAHEFKNKFLTETDHIIQLKWSASPSPGVVSYNIYRNGKKIGNVKAFQPLVFNDHDRSTNRTYVYSVIAVDMNGNESIPATITVKKHRKDSSRDSGHSSILMPAKPI
jgi:autotransporter-associated beta strand protein